MAARIAGILNGASRFCVVRMGRLQGRLEPVMCMHSDAGGAVAPVCWQGCQQTYNGKGRPLAGPEVNYRLNKGPDCWCTLVGLQRPAADVNLAVEANDRMWGWWHAGGVASDVTCGHW